VLLPLRCLQSLPLSAFSVAYTHAAQRLSWAPSLLLALVAWAAAALALSFLPPGITLSLVVSVLTLVSASRLFPDTQSQIDVHAVGAAELCCRMLAGAALTLAVTFAAGRLGSGWSGLLAVFPVLGIVLAVFSHHSQGSAFVAVLLRAMVTGMYSFAAFCFALSFALSHIGVASAFTIAAALSVTVQVLTMRHLTLRSSGLPSAAAPVKHQPSSRAGS
jgi:hypothetical protein